MSTSRGNPDESLLRRELARLGHPSPQAGGSAGRGWKWGWGWGVRRVKSAIGWLSRVAGRGENPVQWAFPIGPVAGVPVRMHVLVVVWVAVELIASAMRSQMGAEYALAAVLAFVFVAMIREAARIAWARRHALVADVSVIWPLGALNPITPVGRSHASATGLRHVPSGGLHVEMGGVFVGLALVPVFVAGALAAGVPAASLWRFDFFSPAGVMAELGTRWQYVFWWLHYANMAILLANVALFAPCFDAGRVLARAMSDRRATNRAAITLWAGLASSVVLGMVALGTGSLRVAIVALVAGLCTWLVFRSQTFLAEAATPSRPAFVGVATSAARPAAARSRSAMPKVPAVPKVPKTGASQGSVQGASNGPASNGPVIEHPARPSRGPLRVTTGAVAPDPAPPSREQVDGILSQISREGMASLSQEQRDTLESATRHLRAR